MIDDSLFAEAVDWARPFVRNTVLNIPSQTSSEHAAALLPQNNSPCEILTFELSIDALVTRAGSDQFAFDVLVNLPAACLQADQQMPANLAGFAADAMDGTRRRPTRRGPQPRRAGRVNRLALGLLVERVARRFGMTRYNNNNQDALTAAKAVTAAMELERHHTSHAAVVNACQDVGEIIP